MPEPHRFQGREIFGLKLRSDRELICNPPYVGHSLIPLIFAFARDRRGNIARLRRAARYASYSPAVAEDVNLSAGSGPFVPPIISSQSSALAGSPPDSFKACRALHYMIPTMLAIITVAFFMMRAREILIPSIASCRLKSKPTCEPASASISRCTSSISYPQCPHGDLGPSMKNKDKAFELIGELPSRHDRRSQSPLQSSSRPRVIAA
jgi:hypothetical protein